MHVIGLALLLSGCGELGSAGFSQSLSESLPQQPEDVTLPEKTGKETCDEATPVTLFVSPDDSNSMSSPVQARAAVLAGFGDVGQLPVRTWEFFNYTTWDYPAAPAGQLALDVQLAEGAEPGTWSMQVAVSAPSLSRAARAPMNLTFVMDESGSMSGTPIEMSRQVLHDISSQLKRGDLVSMVTWDTRNAVVLDGHAVDGPDDRRLAREIDRLRTGGGTDLSGGLEAGYALAAKHQDPGRINRIVLVSDGGANVGETDEEIIGRFAGEQDEDGIYMVGVGVGDAGYNDLLMDRVTDLGRGASVFVTDAAESEKMFAGRFLEIMEVAARDVQIRYDLPPGFELVAFSAEEVSEDPEEVRPQHVAPNDAMVLYQTLASCAKVDPKAEITVTATYLHPLDFTPLEVSATHTLAALLDAATPQLDKGAAIFAYAEALADRGPTVADALAAVEVGLASNPGDADLLEVRTVLDALTDRRAWMP